MLPQHGEKKQTVSTLETEIIAWMDSVCASGDVNMEVNMEVNMFTDVWQQIKLHICS